MGGRSHVLQGKEGVGLKNVALARYIREYTVHGHTLWDIMRSGTKTRQCMNDSWKKSKIPVLMRIKTNSYSNA